jgi:integrase
MRISEARWVDTHRECFRKENGIILLPKVMEIGKKRATISNRTVLLSHAGVKAVEDFFEKNVHFPSYQAMETALKLAAKESDIDPKYITSKMYRKTAISLLITCWPEKESIICGSAGHTFVTMRGHYLGAGFRKEDQREARELFDGFGEAR